MSVRGRKRKDYTGQVFGWLTVIEFVGRKAWGSQWRCRCGCGKEVVVCSSSFARRVSCGCKKKLEMRKRYARTHPKLGRAWLSMALGHLEDE